MPWYAANRDLPAPPYGTTVLYQTLSELRECSREAIRTADLVIVGSYVADGVEVGTWVVETARGVSAFYDLDTPITLSALERGECAYLVPDLIRQYDLYLTFTGGPTLSLLEDKYGARMARPLFCAVDPALYMPLSMDPSYALGYMGTYSADRQPALDQLLLQPALRLLERRFVVVGPQYPDVIQWPPNVERWQHLAPADHPAFYAAQRYTLNLTRADMRGAGYSPSVRLFEAAACGTPIISDAWAGLESFFEPGREILVADSGKQVEAYLLEMEEPERLAIGRRARDLVLAEHTAYHRADALEAYVREVRSRA